MPLAETLFLLSGMLVLALLIQPFSARVRLPFSAALVLAGFLGSELLVALNRDTGLRADDFHDLIFYVFLPILVFESAFAIDSRALLRNLFPILVLAIPVMLLSTLVAGALIYYGIGHPAGFPWIAALLAGALLSATDPVSVVQLFRKLGVPDRLTILMEGESLFNDAVAIVIFSILLGMALDPGAPFDLEGIAVEFLFVFFGGALVGLANGLFFLWLSRFCGEVVLQGVVTLISAYTAYLAAEILFEASGVMAILVTGLIMSRVIRADFMGADRHFVHRFWELNAYLANTLVFLLMGATITLDMFTERWLAMLIGILGVLAARVVGVFGVSPLVSLTPGVERIPLAYQAGIVWGGLRGAVTLALALALPVELDYWWTLQSIAFGVVLFTLFIQGPSMPPLLRKLNLTRDD